MLYIKSLIMRILFFAFSIVLIFLTSCDRGVAPNPPVNSYNDFVARFVYVGQADATLITTPNGKTFLFDAATASGAEDYLIPLLDSLRINHIDVAIASHMHSDHIGGFDDVFEAVPLTGFCYDHGGEYHTDAYDDYITAVADRRRTISIGDTLNIGEVEIVCFASGAEGMTPIGENEKSVAIIISYKGFDLFLGGDLTGIDNANQIDVESHIAPNLPQVELYQSDHHSSRYCNNETILAALRPLHSVISCGIDNMYGFPTPEAVARMSVWSDIYRTDLSGTITVSVIDSSDYVISTQH